jgi:hypothetical protein
MTQESGQDLNVSVQYFLLRSSVMGNRISSNSYNSQQTIPLTTWRSIKSALMLCITIVFFVGCDSSSSSETTVAPYRPIVLETVVVHNTIIPQNSDGTYTALAEPTTNKLKLRVQADDNVKVSVDGIALKRQANETFESDTGWFVVSSDLPTFASRHLFFEIVVNLPLDKRVVANPGKLTLTVEYDSVRKDVQLPPPLIVDLVPYPSLDCIDFPLTPLCMQNRSYPLQPSEVFIDSTDNTKEDNRMHDSIVAYGVVLAGWLTERYFRNDGGESSHRTNESEDWHFDLVLDNDFIVRNYGKVALEPITSAKMPGNVVPLFEFGRGPVLPIQLVSGPVTASTFLMPGKNTFVVELNAWHVADRGQKPDGWVDDPDMTNPDMTNHSGNAWPFNPMRPLGINSTDPDLKRADPALKQVGDYVIVSGTLWEDTGHTRDPQDQEDFLHKCFDEHFVGHGGWLEIHPVDSVRKVDPPLIRRHVDMRSACDPQVPNFDDFIDAGFLLAGDDTTSVLRFEVIVDDRFTSTDSTTVVHNERVEEDCPTKLHVTAKVGPRKTFKATYILWWEKSDQPRAASTNCKDPTEFRYPPIWESLGGILTSAPAVTLTQNGGLVVFARGTDNAIWHTWQDAMNGDWHSWQSLGGDWTSAPAAALYKDGRLNVFAVGTDGAIWMRRQITPFGEWAEWGPLMAEWGPLGGVLTNDPAVTLTQNGGLAVFARGTDEAIWYTSEEAINGVWKGWAPLGGILEDGPAAALYQDGRLNVFARGTDGAIWTRWQLTPNGDWLH